MSTFDLISIEVTPDIAVKIRALAEAGVFAITTGNASINFVGGNIKTIKTEYYHHYPQSQETPIDIHQTSTILKGVV